MKHDITFEIRKRVIIILLSSIIMVIVACAYISSDKSSVSAILAMIAIIFTLTLTMLVTFDLFEISAKWYEYNTQAKKISVLDSENLLLDIAELIKDNNISIHLTNKNTNNTEIYEIYNKV